MSCDKHTHPTRGCQECLRVALPCVDDVRRVVRELDSLGDRTQNADAANAYWHACGMLRYAIAPKSERGRMCDPESSVRLLSCGCTLCHEWRKAGGADAGI